MYTLSLKDTVKNYIHKYNFKRFHSSINYQKPMNVYLAYLKNVQDKVTDEDEIKSFYELP